MTEDPFELEHQLGYLFQDKQLLQRALTRKAYAQEQRQKGQACDDQEVYRLLGDVVLKVILVELLMEAGYDTRESITNRKSDLEKRETLGTTALAQTIAPYLRLGAGERKQGIQKQTSVLGETVEAVIAAIYEDGGFEVTRRLVKRWFRDAV